MLLIDDVINCERMSSKTNDKKEKKAEVVEQATIAELFSFADDFSTKIFFLLGGFFGVLNGLVYPALAFVFSTSFTSITAAEDNGLDNVEDLAFKFLYVGTYAFVVATLQTGCLEIAVSVHTWEVFLNLISELIFFISD